jgi:hypothetical protein
VEAWQNLLPNLVPAIVTGALSLLAAIIGAGVAANTILRRRGEMLLAAQERLYELYGEVITIWRLWNSVAEGVTPLMNDDNKEQVRRQLYDRAVVANGRVEAILLKLTSEQEMDERTLDMVGKFRQAFAATRKHIRRNQPLPWYSSESPDYVAFKRLGAFISHLVVTERPGRRISAERAIWQFRVVTSNYFEVRWQDPEVDMRALTALIASTRSSK